MGLFSSSPAEKEIYKYVGGLFLRSYFNELLKSNNLFKAIPGESDYYIGNSIQKILEYKTKRNKIKVSEIESELYLLLKKARYLKKRNELFSIKTCPTCQKQIYNSVCTSCGFNLLDNHEFDYDELKKIQIFFPSNSRSPYSKYKSNNHVYVDKDEKRNNNKPIAKNTNPVHVTVVENTKTVSTNKKPIVNNTKMWGDDSNKIPLKFKDYTIDAKFDCVNCEEHTRFKLTKSSFLFDNEVHYCTSCGLTLEKSGNEYKFVDGASNNKHIQSYKNQKFTMNEWKRIAKGGLSDKEIEMKEKHEKGMNAYKSGIDLFKKGIYDKSHSQFSTAKSNLDVSSIEHSLATIYCSAFDLVSFNKYLAENPENFHRPTLKSVNFHVGMETMQFNPGTLRALNKDRYDELIMAINFITETLLEIPKNNYCGLKFITHKEKSVAELWKKIAKYTLSIKENSKIYVLIGCLRTKDDSYEDPEPCFKKAIRRAANNDPSVYITIGDFYSDEMNYFSKAAYYYTKAISFPSMQTSENYKALGSFYGLDGYHEDAVYYFNKGIECPDADFDIYGRKAQSLVQLGRYEEADECFDEFFKRIDIELKANPTDINLLRAKAVTLASIGEKREALDVFLKIEKINPNAEFLKEDLMRLGI